MLHILCALSFVPPAPLPPQSDCVERPSLEAVGHGTPGAAGFALVRPTPGPFVGESSAFALEGGLPGAVGSLFASPVAATPPVPLPGFGATWFLGAPLVAEDFVVGPDGRAAGLFAQATVSPALCGKSVWLQAIQFDAAAAGGLAFTPGLAVRFGARSGPLLPTPLDLPGDSVVGVALADLDADGQLDAALADPGLDQVVVLLGRGDGTFDGGPVAPVGSWPRQLRAADLDGDGVVDLAVIDQLDETVSVLLGLGDGSFAAAVAYPTGNDPYDLDLADLDGDGALDLLVVDRLDATVTVWLGVGDGTFTAAPKVATAVDPRAAVVYDATEDGVPDLLVVGLQDNVLRLHRGVGDGTFTFDPATDERFVGWDPVSLAAGDLDDDGRVDLVCGVCCGSVTVLRGLGAGVFSNPIAYPAEDLLESLALVDMDGDGALDVVAASRQRDAVGVLRGGGDGSLADFDRALGVDGPLACVVGDVNSDGTPDAAYVSGGRFGLLFGEAGVGLVGPTVLPGFVDTSALVVADLNGDGVDDLASVRSSFGGLAGTTSLGVGDGGFWPAELVLFSGGMVDLEAVDLDADGVLDLVAVSKLTSVVQLAFGVGDGTFAVPVSLTVGTEPEEVEAGDLNGDGWVDLVVSNGGGDDLSLLFATAPGVFAAPVSLPAGVLPRGLALADLDADGDLDLVATNGSELLFAPPATPVRDGYVWLNPGDGQFSSPFELGPGEQADRVVVGDVDDDGVLDLVVNDWGGVLWGLGGVRVYRGAGDGTFALVEAHDLGLNPREVALGDVDLDGRVDLVVAEGFDLGFAGGRLTVRSGLAPGGATLFGEPQGFAVGSNAERVLAVDLDRDGLLELLADDNLSGPVALFGLLAD